MPYREKETEKIYFTIGEVADFLGCYTSKIRFWDLELNLKIPKDKRGDRQLTKKHIKTLQYIHERSKYCTMEGFKLILKKGASFEFLEK